MTSSWESLAIATALKENTKRLRSLLSSCGVEVLDPVYEAPIEECRGRLAIRTRGLISYPVQRDIGTILRSETQGRYSPHKNLFCVMVSSEGDRYVLLRNVTDHSVWG